MTGLIKRISADLGVQVRALPTAPTKSNPAPPLTAAETETARLREIVEDLSQRLAQRDAQVQALEADVRRAAQEGEARGRELGLAEAVRKQDEMLELLGEGVRQAKARVLEDLAECRRLAPLIACAGLERILGPGGRQAAMVKRIVARQLDLMEAQTVLRVEVSRADFPDPKQLAALSAELGRPATAILASEHLRPGDCRIKLAIGAHDVGVGQQWAVLSQALRDMAGVEVQA